MPSTQWTVRRALAAFSATLIVVTYVTCICIALGEGTYVGGLSFPYFSDTGRDKPAYYVFSILITIASISLMAFQVLQFKYVRAWLPDNEARRRNIAASVLGFVSGIASSLFAIFDTSNYSAIHSYSAYVFFIFVVGHVCLSTSIYRTLRHKHEVFRNLMIPRYIALVMLLVAFIIYIPVGLALACEWTRLSLLDCYSYVMDVDYCDSHVYDEDPTLTVLWNYDECSEVNVMRSGSQFVCIVSMMLFIVVYALDPRPGNPVDATNTKEQSQNVTTDRLTGTTSHDITMS